MGANSWPALPAAVDPAYAASVSAALAAKADAATVATELLEEADIIDVAAGAAALRRLGDDEGWAANFRAQSAAVVSRDGSKSAMGKPTDLVTFTRATTGQALGVDGYFQSFAAGEIRYSHDPATGVPRGARFEPAATNLYLNSLAAGSQQVVRGTINSNVAIGHDGTTSADELVEDTQDGGHYVYQNITPAALTPHTFARWIKPGTGRTRASMTLYSAFNGSTQQVVFDLSAGTATLLAGTATYGMTYYPVIGMWRVWITATSGASPSSTGFVMEIALNDNDVTYVGDGSSLIVGNAMVTATPVPMTDIVTGSGTVVRNSDVMMVPPSRLPMIAGQVGGFLDFTLDHLVSSQRILSLSDGTANNRIEFYTGTGAGDTLSATVTVGGVNHVSSLVASGLVAGTRYKLAFGARKNDFRVQLSGKTLVSDTSLEMPVLDRAYLMAGATGTTSTVGNGVVGEAAIVTRPYSTAEIAALVA